MLRLHSANLAAILGCDFLLLVDVNEWMSYKYSDAGTTTQNICKSSTLSHRSEDENRSCNTAKIASVDKFVKPLFHSMQKPTRKLAASAFKYCDWMKVLAASLRVGFCDEWKRALKLYSINKLVKFKKTLKQKIFGTSFGHERQRHIPMSTDNQNRVI